MEKFLIPPRTDSGNEINKFFLNVVQYINELLATRNAICRAYLSADQTGVADNTLTKVAFDEETCDVGNNYAGSKYTCSSPGYYQISWRVPIISGGGVLDEAITVLYKNGAAVSTGSGIEKSSGGFSRYRSTGCDTFYCATGDYLEIYGRGNTSDASTVTFSSGSPNCYMTVTLVSK